LGKEETGVNWVRVGGGKKARAEESYESVVLEVRNQKNRAKEKLVRRCAWEKKEGGEPGEGRRGNK